MAAPYIYRRASAKGMTRKGSTANQFQPVGGIVFDELYDVPVRHPF